MGKKEYMEILLGQIRNKKVRELVFEEIGSHIDDQAETFRSKGMDAPEAERRAVREMGDPVETGASLDRIHRPKTAWGMILLIGIINLAGLLLLAGIASEDTAYLLRHQIGYAAAGYGVMILICLLDYTWIGKYCGVLSLVFLGICAYGCISGRYIYGEAYYLWLPFGSAVSLQMLAYLSVPLSGALLYRCRKKTWKHLLVPVVFMAAVLLLLLVCGCGAVLMINLALIDGVLVTFAVQKGWYPVKKKLFSGALWGCLIVIFGILLLWNVSSLLFASYEVSGTAMFSSADAGSSGIASLLSESSWIGASRSGRMIFNTALGWASDYMVMYILAYDGLLIFLGVAVLFGVLCMKMFGMSLRQKNQFGSVMGLGCSMVFFLQIVEYMLVNLEMIPPMSAFLPLLSYGGSGTVISYILLGILLSAHRYQNLTSEKSLEKRRYRLRIERV